MRQTYVDKFKQYYQNLTKQKGGSKLETIEALIDTENPFKNRTKEDIEIKRDFRKDYRQIDNTTFKNMDGKIFTTFIPNTLSEPWFEWIKNGKQKYLLKLNKGKWRNIKTNDILLMKDEKGHEIITSVEKMNIYPQILDAYRDLKYNLLPIKGLTSYDVEDIYLSHYSKDEIDKNGLIAIKFKKI
jgi:ASC-1-like (ASCH) protein